MKIAAVLLALVLLATSCFLYREPAPPTEYGAYPENYRELIEGYMKDETYFRDRSFQILDSPRRAYELKGLIFGGGVAFTGYAVAMNVTDEDGSLTWYALIRDGVLIDVTTNAADLLRFVD